MNWLSRFLPGSGPGLSPEQQTRLEAIAALPACDTGRSHYETRYVVVNTETGPQDGGGQRLLAVGAVALNHGLLHPGDAFHALAHLVCNPGIRCVNDLGGVLEHRIEPRPVEGG